VDDVAILVDRATILGTIMEIRTERAAAGLSMQWTSRGRLFVDHRAQQGNPPLPMP
jgi:hypothetical protein